MRLSAHFSLHELTRSQLANRYGLDNTPHEAALTALKPLCTGFLEPLRVHVRRPIYPSSGFRAPSVNRLLGSHDGSQHCRGEAVDFEVGGFSNINLARHIAENMAFDQLILEYPQPDNPHAGWLHVSYRDGHNRQMVLTRTKSGYKRGIALADIGPEAA